MTLTSPLWGATKTRPSGATAMAVVLPRLAARVVSLNPLGNTVGTVRSSKASTRGRNGLRGPAFFDDERNHFAGFQLMREAPLWGLRTGNGIIGFGTVHSKWQRCQTGRDGEEASSLRWRARDCGSILA